MPVVNRAIPSLALMSAVTFMASSRPGSGEEVAGELVVMSFNVWHDGSKVQDGFEKIAAAIRAAEADVVGLQESSPDTARRLARELGWEWADGATRSVQILSRHPVVRTITAEGVAPDRFIGARLRLDGNPQREMVVGNVHLDHRFYGPYAAREQGATVETVLAENSRSDRLEQLRAVLEAMKPMLAAADDVPVVLTGDFNAPSHLDWTAEATAARGVPGPVPWQESRLAAATGFIDSFRRCHPDPVATPGFTWSPVHKDPEPQDRIDFIYHLGKPLVAESSRAFTTAVEATVGAWGEDTAPVAGNTWPSDHAAVVTRYRTRWENDSAEPGGR